MMAKIFVRPRWKGLGTALAVLASIGTPLRQGQSQTFESLQTPAKPLSLESTGSFFIGGRVVQQSLAETGLYTDGPVTVDQMYVQYMIPVLHHQPAVIMIHGATLSGKTYETTPDGRMGWYEYFARRGFPSYVVDQVGRARSGFNQAPFNDVREKVAGPSTQPHLRRFTDDSAWVRFRFGTADGRKFADTQFPVEAAAELSKQNVPDINEGLPQNNPTYSDLSQLAIKLKGAVLIGHSQSGRFPLDIALLNSAGVRGAVVIEPSGCNAGGYTNAEISKLAKIPILVLFGDHVDATSRYGVPWANMYQDCRAFVTRIKAAKGNATFLYPPELGIRGNSHMIMQDKNNLAIADLIISWIGSTIR